MNPKLKNAKIKARELRVNTGNGPEERACSQAALVLSPTALLSLRPCVHLPRTTKHSPQQTFQPRRFPQHRPPWTAAPVRLLERSSDRAALQDPQWALLSAGCGPKD